MKGKSKKKSATKNVRAANSKAKKPAAAEPEVVTKPTPDMIGRIMETGREMEGWDLERFYELIEKHPILSKNMDYFETLSQDDMKSVVSDATSLVLKKMGEMR